MNAMLNRYDPTPSQASRDLDLFDGTMRQSIDWIEQIKKIAPHSSVPDAFARLAEAIDGATAEIESMKAVAEQVAEDAGPYPLSEAIDYRNSTPYGSMQSHRGH